MASVFKRSNSNRYYIEWFDHTGKRCTRSSGTTDEKAARRIANKYEEEAALRREKVVDPRIEEMAAQLNIEIRTHLRDFVSAMEAKGTSEEHCIRTEKKILAICDSAGCKLLRDLNATGVNRFAADQRKTNAAARTIQSYLTAIKSFTSWLIKQGKLASDPLATIQKPTVENDRRRVRRYLSHEEWQWLDLITRRSEDRFGMTGRERALLYATAIQTGLRSSELQSLTRGRLRLIGDSPFIMAVASSTKNKKDARQYIQPELAAELADHTSKMLSGSKLFNMPPTYEVAKMLRADLDEARAAWLATIEQPQEKIEADEGDFLRSTDSAEEILDFHSLRHTCATWLIHSGADIKTVQTIMRHSDIKLTIQTYGHLFPGSEAAAVQRVRLNFAKPVELKKTGTENLQYALQQSGNGSGRSIAKSCEETTIRFESALRSKPNENAGETYVFLGEKENRTGRTRTDNQGIMSHEVSNEKATSTDGLQYASQQWAVWSTDETCKLYRLLKPTNRAELLLWLDRWLAAQDPTKPEPPIVLLPAGQTPDQFDIGRNHAQESRSQSKATRKTH